MVPDGHSLGAVGALETGSKQCGALDPTEPRALLLPAFKRQDVCSNADSLRSQLV